MAKSIFAAMLIGGLIGYFFFGVEDKDWLDTTLMSALYVMVFIAGIEIGGNRHLLKKIATPRSMALALMIPASIIVGSLGAAYLVAPLIGMTRPDAVLVASGLGWYSLSSVVVSTQYNTEIGTIAFLANMFRETGAILILPFLAKWNKLIILAPAGAATMDSGLPIVINNSNVHIGMFGFISGLVITLVVPVLLAFFLPG